MTSHRFEFGLAATFVLLIAVSWLWQNPGVVQGPLTPLERERYLAALQHLPLPEAERPGLMQAARAWMDSDDGQPVYMLNVMRYYPELLRFAGAPAIEATPQQSITHYEDQVMPLLFRVGGYPAYAGEVRNRNLLEHGGSLDDWSRVLLVRYPSRRAFLDLISNPAYAPIEPYKLMALRTMLTPTQPELVIPPLPWLMASLLLPLFLATGWWRAARRNTHREQR